jgi:hypothetical protein
MVEPLGFAIEATKGDSDVDVRIGDTFLDLLFGGGEAGGLCETGRR